MAKKPTWWQASVSLDISGFKILRDVEPGEVIIITEDIKCSKVCEKPVLAPCLFEYVYFARPDSIMNKFYQKGEVWKDRDID